MEVRVTNGFGKIKFVPYRDSALTWLLKDCFTGGASSFIIATVSPSVACYGESASTLRWAARARQLPSTSPQLSGTIVASKADLQAQLDLLIAELANDYIRYVPETGKISYDDIHWTLQKNRIVVNSENKIGAFLDIMHRKSDSRNEESSSSLALSDSSDFIGAEDKNKITNEINKEVDKILGTSLERTSSGCDLKVVPPLRHKRREYRSQEVLPINETIDRNQEQNIAQIVNSHSDIQINTNKEQTELIKVPHASIIHENQRSEIVAAVTERLYSKLKKKEIPAVHKMESIVDKKIVEPLSELRICTNARQRLIELSQKAIRNKRKIGIPVSTQTRMSVIRVKDKAVDVQADLDSYIVDRLKSYSLYRDVATETIAMTPRCKEQSVGPAFGSMRFRDFSTPTEIQKNSSKNSYTMTDICGQCDNSTQTQILPPPRRKKRCPSFPKNVNNSNTWNVSEEATVSPVISINISQTYPVDSDSQSSDENSNTATDNCKVSPKASTPDLLTNHTADAMDAVENHISVDGTDSRQLNFPYSLSLEASDVSETQYCEHEFSDSDEHALPRVKVGSLCQNKSDIKDLILGRNKNMFPYNIMLSPEKVKDSCKRTVSFKDFDIDHAMKMATKANQLDHEHDTSLSDSTGSSKMETDSFIWKSNKTLGCSRGHYVPVYKPSKYNTTKALYNKDLSRLEKRLENELTPLYCIGNASERNTEDCHSLKNNYHDYKIFENMNKMLEHKLNSRRKYDFPTIEKNILASCEKLECIANKYDDYVSNIEKVKENSLKKSSLGTPTEYLQRLIQIRKSVIKSESEDTDSSLVSHK
ncbi:kinesin-like protein KIF15-B [Bombyx mandarina]|uniref:Kinesin-like protein KIF15-B n=1 Tax=Bombyx mandarina TaxID=7092 RepID=A0A6J2JWP5_BOMMA|nr:kinesin-like protein KIF15-B [Bombyx mandarina]